MVQFVLPWLCYDGGFVHIKFNFCTWVCSLISALLQEVFASLVTGWVFVSGITWVLVYRTDKYKRLKAEVEKQSKKCKYSPGAYFCP